MLTAATLGMTGYGFYSVAAGITDLLGQTRLEWQADLALIVLGAMLVLAGLFVRVRVPGSLALSLAALFGLQSLALHNAGHLYGRVAPEPQIARAILGVVLIALAYFGQAGGATDQESGDRRQETGGG